MSGMAFSRLPPSGVEECTNLLNDCVLIEFKKGQERPLYASDFSDLRDKMESTAKQIIDILKYTSDEPDAEFFPFTSDLGVLLFVFCGENFSESFWTSHSTKENCKFIYDCVFGPGESRQSLLLEDQGKLLKKYLYKVRLCLHSSQWKKYPTAVHSYVWCLTSLRIPYLGEYLDILLPTSLVITDDFDAGNKVIGVKCLHHIVKNVTYAELRIRSHEEVIYKTLEMCLFERNAELIPVLIACLLDLLKKMYFLSTDQLSKVLSVNWTHYDEIMSKYLYQLKLETNIDVRKAMLESLIKLITSSGFIYVRYLGNLVEIIDESAVHPSCVLTTLKLMLEVLRVKSPCVEHYLKQVTFIVLRILYSWDSFKPLTFEEIKAGSKEVLIHINTLNGDLLQEVTNSKQFNKLQSEVRSTIEEVTAQKGTVAVQTSESFKVSVEKRDQSNVSLLLL